MPNPIELQKSLAGASYPSSKEQLIERAKANGANQDVLADLKKLPDREFDGPDQVQKAIF
jgi:hypothetical protein